MINPATYFDSAASTPLDPQVQKAMLDNLSIWGNNNSQHVAGQEANSVIIAGLKKIASVLKCNSDQLVITYSGTDSNRRFIHEANKLFSSADMWSSAVEHSSISDEIPPTNYFDPISFHPLPSSVKFIAQMAANAETGAIYPGDSLRHKYPKALILRDFSQSFAKGLVPDLENCDAGTFAPQKFYGPKMVGLLYLKNPERFPSLAKDSHTKNAWLVAGMAQAFVLWKENHQKWQQQLTHWAMQIENYLQKNASDYKIHDAHVPRIPGLINVAFAGVRGSELMTILSDNEEICVSTGSACMTDILSPTPVISFLEPDPRWQYPIRISLHRHLTDQAVAEFCEILLHYVADLRKIKT